ncbi:hypothetical protein J6590_008814 [Homalodisca vitripennis]|nr:hypothetical protein J6590_008814 [Homalodisca vitripennis]
MSFPTTELSEHEEDSDSASSRRTHETTPEQDVIAKIKREGTVARKDYTPTTKPQTHTTTNNKLLFTRSYMLNTNSSNKRIVHSFQGTVARKDYTPLPIQELTFIASVVTHLPIIDKLLFTRSYMLNTNSSNKRIVHSFQGTVARKDYTPLPIQELTFIASVVTHLPIIDKLLFTRSYMLNTNSSNKRIVHSVQGTVAPKDYTPLPIQELTFIASVVTHLPIIDKLLFTRSYMLNTNSSNKRIVHSVQGTVAPKDYIPLPIQ